MNRFDIALKKPIPNPQSKRFDKHGVENHRIYKWKGWTVFKEDFPRAVKEHACPRCDKTILKGHFYKTITLKSLSGTYDHMKLCLSCAAFQSKDQLY
jgi:hypothetical protein